MHAESTPILLIEDDLADAELMQIALRRSGGNYHVTHAGTLDEGLSLAGRSTFQVIMTDLGLSDAVGLDSVKRLSEACRDSAIIALSGQSDEQLYVDAISNGADTFLCKSEITPLMVHRCVQQSIQRFIHLEQVETLVREVREQKAILEEQADLLAQKNARLELQYDASQKFVNNVSHEFRTPLCVVKQYASLVADGAAGEVTEDQTRMLRVIEDRVDDLNNMVDDMLDISRHESGLLAAHRERCDVEDMVTRVLPGLRRRAKLRGIEMELAMEDGLPPVFCDPEKVSRTLINLIVNAIKFSKEGSSIVVGVSTCDGNREIRIAVQDQGPGIDAEQQKQIFARFRQINTNLQSSTKGFGLGLNIAKELVDINLGQMSVQSVLGEGSTFSFTIPYDEPSAIVTRYFTRAKQTAENGVISLITVTVPHDTSELCPNRDVHLLLDFLLRGGDLLLPMSASSWLVLLRTPAKEVDGFLDRAHKEIASVNRNRPQGPLPPMEIKRRGTVAIADGVDTLLNHLQTPTVARD